MIRQGASAQIEERGIINLQTPASTTPRPKDLPDLDSSSCAPLFLFWTVHGPFSLFHEKEKMGGGIDQPSLAADLPARQGK
ncbi:MAG: hypothetical protein HDT19_08420 [Oscillibacter sp.]|nr:hypothetical protein [Oscillibacter sp.]